MPQIPGAKPKTRLI